MEGKTWIGLLILSSVAAGCGGRPEAPFPDWVGRSDSSAQPTPFSAELIRAGLDAEHAAAADRLRVSFTPGRIEALSGRLRAATDSAIAAARKGGQLADRSAAPFAALPAQTGWRHIARVLIWRIESNVASKPPKAAEACVDAVRFGLALTGGSATDAALGFAIAENAVEAIRPSLGRIGPAELRNLGTGIEAALRLKPQADSLIRNEQTSMLLAVQALQDAFRDRALVRFKADLGREAEPALAALEKLRDMDSRERAAYFRSLAEEAELWVDRARLELSRNARQRAQLPSFEIAGDRPWRRFARHFFTSLTPLPQIRDRSICRIRLLGMEALLRAELRANGVAPTSLTGISKDLTTDPYSGQPLVYRPEYRSFLLYSVGENLADDGGEEGRDISAR